MADGIKSLTKEDIIPCLADAAVHFLAPLLLVLASFLAYAVLPVGRNMVITDLNAGVLFFFAIGSMVELAVFMAGWSSRSKYSLLGAMRAVAQMISYEIPLVLSAIVIIMAAGTLSTVSIVNMQAVYTHKLAHWFLFTPWGFCGFILFMIAATAESNRSPFDLPEGESEIIAGYYIEYSGFKFALFFLGEYLGMFATSGLAITLFLGGWSALFSFFTLDPLIRLVLRQAFCSSLSSSSSGVRGTFPAVRAWTSSHGTRLEVHAAVMTLLNVFDVGIWHLMPHGILRWIVCTALLVLSAFLLSRTLNRKQKLQCPGNLPLVRCRLKLKTENPQLIT